MTPVRILIANRGEVAVRIARTLRSLGIESVGIYAPADAGSPHVRSVDRAVRLESGDGAVAYLSIEAVIDAARQSQCDAVHPGYGFLSESAEAAGAVEAAGLTWIGPSPDSIRRLGEKASAKQIAIDAGIPVVPGRDESQGPIDESSVSELAAAEGYPLMLKAAAGGGGKGMRRIDDGGEIADSVASARREAEASFGSGALLVEALVEPARHIEVQIASDPAGTSIALGERDCSLQRRHQKLIEESPAPGIGQPQRDALQDAAIRLADAVGYRNLGTVEFLVDARDPDRFYFLEMNSRLQVEHPVTEAVTGLDLVAMQVAIAGGEDVEEFVAGRSATARGLIDATGITWESARCAAAGEPLPKLPLSGRHAVEARICAERPEADFVPATGRVLAYVEPEATGARVRVDSGVQEGSQVGTGFDPMLAKVIACSHSREAAIGALRSALADLVIFGVETNSAYLRWLLGRPEVAAGSASVTTVEELQAEAAYSRQLEEVAPVLGTAAAVASALDSQAPAQRHGFDRLDSWRASARKGSSYFRVAAPGANGPQELQIDPRSTDFEALGPGRMRVGDDSYRYLVEMVPGARRAWVQGSLGTYVAEVPIGVQSQLGSAEGSLDASMPGRVLAVHVAQGESVSKGQGLLTMESMKMELQVSAPRAGEVTELPVSAGDHVERGQVLAVIGGDDG